MAFESLSERLQNAFEDAEIIVAKVAMKRCIATVSFGFLLVIMRFIILLYYSSIPQDGISCLFFSFSHR